MNTNIMIVDEMMGKGKSSAAINHINNSTDEERFIVITPYLNEVKRYKNCCGSKHFIEPSISKGSKLNGIKELIRDGKNIVSTHALFRRFDSEVINLCRVLNYTLIMDEVATIIEDYPISKDDIENLKKNYCDVEEGTNLLKWRESEQSYEGKFSEIKTLCNLGSLAYYNGDVLMWMFPIEVFKSFENIFILTYMFGSQLQRYYYDYYSIPYKYIHVVGDNIENYRFSETSDDRNNTCNYSDLIHIVYHEKMNLIGEEKYSLGSTWYQKNDKSAVMNQLKNNIYNYFNNLMNGKSKDNLWTCFKPYKSSLAGKGYTKGFLSLNARATNEYRERSSVAYPVNIFLKPVWKNFFVEHGVDVDEDGYALSEMLQFIWRSAIRDGKEIYVYVPSQRMRNLLENWIMQMEN